MDSKIVKLPKGVKKSEQYITAEIEQILFSKKTGERLSRSREVTFLPEDWTQFKTHGPRQGWTVLRVIEAPEGVDLTYGNPEGKPPEPVVLGRKK